MVLVDSSVWIEAARRDGELAYEVEVIGVRLYSPAYGGSFAPEAVG